MVSNNDDNASVLNSELAVKVMRRIASQENGDYGSSIAKSLDKSQASIGRILSELRDIGFLEKGNRKKAQYYEIDYNSIGNYWFERVFSELEEMEGGINRKKYLVEGYTTKEEMKEGMEKYEEEINEVVAKYIRSVLTSDARLEKLTVSELLFESLGYSIGHNWIQDKQLLEKHPYLEQPIDALVYLWNMDGFPVHLREVID